MKRRTLLRVLSGSVLAIAATTACGGASNAGLFGSGGSVQGTAGTAAHGGSGAGAHGGRGPGGSGAGGTRATGGSGMGGSASGGTSGSGAFGGTSGGSGFGGTSGGSGGTSGSGGSGGFGGTGGSGGSGGFGGTGGSGGSGGSEGIACGSATCSVGTNFCCYFDNKAPACNPIGTQCYPSTDLYCDGPEDCPSGQMCCGQLIRLQNGQYKYNEVRCSSTCDYAQHQRVFCHDTSQCSSGETCQQSQTLPAYTVCGY